MMSATLIAVLADADRQPHTATSTPAPQWKPGHHDAGYITAMNSARE
jgi:hypothetical protein